MDRRSFIGATAAATIASASWARASAQNPVRPTDAPATDLFSAARDAWIYGLALIENAASRADVLKHVAPNTVFPQRELVGWEWREVTTPNNDTLYERVWMDLSRGPVKLTLPKTGSRYVSYHFMDMYMNSFAVLGTRTTGEDGGQYTIVGPTAATTDTRAIRAPTPWVWMTQRVLVDGASDLANGHKVQDGLRVAGPRSATPRPTAKRDAPWAEYFSSVQRLMVENPPPATDNAALARFRLLGLDAAGGFSANRFSPVQAAEIERGVSAAKTLLKTTPRQGQVAEGWVYPKYNLGDFGQDYLYRAQVALGGLGALPINEAVYVRPLGPDRFPILDSGRDWRLVLPADRLPPVDGFWSLSMYEQTPDNQFFFVKNAIDRYAIGDRTPDLKRRADGAIVIRLSRRPPVDPSENWLPAPQDRPMSLVLRAYLPKDPLLSGAYRLPPLEAL